MNKFALSGFVCWALLVTGLAQANVDFSDTGFRSPEITGKRTTVLDIVLGYGVDDFSFDIASDPAGLMTPNILSELIWTDVKVGYIRGDFRWPIGDHLAIRALADYGFIFDGDVLDNDYLGDDRTMLFTSASATVDGDYRYRGKLDVGWEFRFSFAVPLWQIGDSAKRRSIASEISITPKIGYEIAGHEINFKDGVLLVPDVGGFAGLDSSYSPEWSGMVGGVDIRARLSKRLIFKAEYNYSDWLDFEAEGSWNLREDLQQDPSFTQDSGASGQRIEAGIEYLMGEKRDKSFYLSYVNIDYQADPGTDTTFDSDGNAYITRLNGARWQGEGFEIGFRMKF